MSRDDTQSPPPRKRGRLIVLEGGDGTGKSTQARLLGQHLNAVVTRQAGGTPFGSKLREITLDSETAGLSDRAEALLYMADRAEHVAALVEPALARGQHVVSDRWAYSTLAYQGYAGGLDPDQLWQVSDWAMQGLWPDVVLLLEVPFEVSAARRSGRQADHYEASGEEFHALVATGYRKMAEADPQRWRVIDASGSVDSVHDAVRAAVADFL